MTWLLLIVFCWARGLSLLGDVVEKIMSAPYGLNSLGTASLQVGADRLEWARCGRLVWRVITFNGRESDISDDWGDKLLLNEFFGEVYEMITVMRFIFH